VLVSASIADHGDGAKLCLGPSTSARSNCGGTTIDGIDRDTPWINEHGGELSGRRLVEITWPPLDNRVQLVSDRPAMHGQSTYLPGLSISSTSRFARPTDCREQDLGNSVDFDAYLQWGAAHPDEYGGVFVAGAGPRDHGVPAMQVKASGARLEEIRAELTSAEASPCLVTVNFTETELLTTFDQFDSLNIPGGLGWGIGKDGVQADLVAIDRQTVDAIVAGVDRPDLIELTIEGFLR